MESEHHRGRPEARPGTPRNLRGYRETEGRTRGERRAGRAEPVPPVGPGWRERSRFIARHGEVDFFHYDFVSQALAKLARAHDRDLADAREMLARGLVTREDLREAFAAVRAGLLRFPSLDERAFAARLEAFLGGARMDGSDERIPG